MVYTRKEYVHGAPSPTITIFEMGDLKGEYNAELVIRAAETGVLSDRSLEALRVHVNRALGAKTEKFYYKISRYPHVILRGKKWLAFAGADRISSGMKKAFGKPSGRALEVRKNQEIAVVRVDKSEVEYVKKVLKSVTPKLPILSKIEIKEIQN